MINREEIKKRLRSVPPRYCAAFAARCALRVLPLLAANDKEGIPFWYWKPDVRTRHLLAVLTAQRCSAAISAFGRISRSGISFLAAADAADAAAADAYAAAAAAAAADAAADAYAAADDAAAAAARAATINSDTTIYEIIEKEILADLDTITSGAKSGILDRFRRKEKTPVIEKSHLLRYLASPLWPSGEIPKELRPVWERFCRWTRELDAGFDIWLDWYRDHLAGKPLDLELLEKQANIPAEIQEQGVKAVNAYLATLEEKNVLPLNLVRAIFIGNGEAGKTSLIRVLHGEPVVEGKEPMTPGINIRSWPVGGTGITARLWDFGGQVMAHATHQFFLRERCLYLLVVNARTEINANDQAEYWLEHVKAFGRGAPVMIVGNKSDLVPVNLDMRSLREKYPNIVDFYPVSCTRHQDETYRQLFEVFRSSLIGQLQRVGTHQIYFTRRQFNALEEVRQLSPRSVFLPHKEFDRLCARHAIGEGSGLGREDFLGLLDKLGEVIHFPQIRRLDSYILNPRWLTYGVYTLLYSEKLSLQKGVISETDAFGILSAEEDIDECGNALVYPPEKCGFIIDAMEAFRICYRLPGNPPRFVIPDKLPAEQPALDFEKARENTLVFEFSFAGFLPRHVMPTLIVSRHEEIVDGMVWQNGVVLRNKTHHTTALAQVDYHLRSLRIWVQGNGAREMLSILNDEVTKILQRMEGLEYKVYVELPGNACMEERPGIAAGAAEKATYERLIAEARQGKQVFVSDSGARYDLNKILGAYMTSEEQKQKIVNYHFNAQVGAVGGAGDHQEVHGTVFIGGKAHKEAAQELSGHITALMEKIERFEADFMSKMAAYNELEQARKALQDVKDGKPIQKHTLKDTLGKIKDGTLVALAFAKQIKDSAGTVEWIVKSAATLFNLLA